MDYGITIICTSGIHTPVNIQITIKVLSRARVFDSAILCTLNINILWFITNFKI